MKTTLALCAVTGLSIAVACSAGGASTAYGGGPDSNATGGAPVFGSGGGAVIGTGAESSFGGSFGGSFGTPVGGPDTPDAACKAVTQKAEKALGGKADIIWVLDNSGSMATEAAGIQNNMNVFSSFITGTGIDVHVVAVSSGPGILPFVPPYGLCIAPPLGSGQPCPNDTNPPLYTHVVQEVDSHNALQQLMGTYPQWQGVIRPDSTKTFVVVSDDEANPAPTSAEFTTFFNQQFQGSKWRFSGVFCQTTGPANCAGAGVTYTALVSQTGGVWADMSNPDWTVVFKQLADAVVADARPVDCVWSVPPPPDGQKLDPDKVNVRFTPSSGTPETLYALDDKSACTDNLGGWYFDNRSAPTQVLACPSSCTRMQADQNAKVDVLFGCARTPPPLM
jgi:hypothetical protein